MVDNFKKGKYYIYTLEDPETNDIRYVGQTNNLQNRYRQHICLKGGRKIYSKAWIKSLSNRGLLPLLKVLDEGTVDNINELEIYWISQFKTWGFKLTNLTSGGEGTKEYRHTPEAKKKIVKALQKRKCSQKSIDALVKYNKSGRSLEHRRKLSEAMKGKPPGNKGKSPSIETRRLQSIAKKGKPNFKKRAPILQYNLDNAFIKEWRSATEAAEELHLTRANIVACLNGRRNRCGNFLWKYKIEDIVRP